MMPFTLSKTRVRELNLRAMQNCLGESGTRTGWSYFGLPSPNMEDVICWQAYLRSVDAVERGIPGLEWKSQHDLARTAMLHGIKGFRRYCGEIDDLILSEGQLGWRFDVINLDYTGGITYKNSQKHSKRIEAIRALIQKQGENGKEFFLNITVNDRHHDEGEIKTILAQITRLCRTRGVECEERMNLALKDQDQRFSAFFYTTYVVTITGQQWFKITAFRPIFYTGKGNYRMLNMTFCFKTLPGRDAPVGETFDVTKIPFIKPIYLDTENKKEP